MVLVLDRAEQHGAPATRRPVRRLMRGMVGAVVAGFIVVGVVVTLIPLNITRQGMGLVTLTGGSMEPAYSVGQTVKIRAADSADELQVGDVITFRAGSSLVTHRIIERVSVPRETSIMLRTQGDANEASDANLVHPRSVVGVVVGGLDRFEQVAVDLQGYRARLVIFGVPLLAIAVHQSLASVKGVRAFLAQRNADAAAEPETDPREQDLVG